MNLSGADHVHNLHKHEQVEEEGEVLGVATWVHDVFEVAVKFGLDVLELVF